MKQTFPDLFEKVRVRPVDDYCSQLLNALQSLMDDKSTRPSVAILTPGVHNSAYFEHSFLAQQMGVDLVEGRDLVVSGGFVHMRTTQGLERIDVCIAASTMIFSTRNRSGPTACSAFPA